MERTLQSEQSACASSNRHEEEESKLGDNIAETKPRPSRNCAKRKRNGQSPDRTPKVSKMLKQSLAVLLVRVCRDSGKETAEKILEVLQDDYFDLKEFQENVTTLKECEEITQLIVKK